MPDTPCPPNQAPEPLGFTPAFDPYHPGLIQRTQEKISKVIVLRASRIGDFINATPALRALKQALPQAELTVITLPMLRELAERCPAVDRVVIFPGYPGLADQFFSAERTLAFFTQMQGEKFDLAIQMQGTGVYSNPFMLMLGARQTAGFIRPGDPAGRLDAALPWPETGHEIRRVLALTEFLGIPTPHGVTPEIRLKADDRRQADQLLESIPRPWIGIHTSARDHTRRWPLARFVDAAAILQKKHGGTVIVLGESRERNEIDALLAAGGVPNLNLAGCTSLTVTGAILEQIAVFLTNDTGPAHLAYVGGAATVTIFGGGDPTRNGPFVPGPFRVVAHPIACRPCESPDCPIDLECLRHVSVAEVVTAAEEILQLEPTAERWPGGLADQPEV